MTTEQHSDDTEYHGYDTHTIKLVHSEKYAELYDAVVFDESATLVGWCVWYRSKVKALEDAKGIVDIRTKDRASRDDLYYIVANE